MHEMNSLEWIGIEYGDVCGVCTNSNFTQYDSDILHRYYIMYPALLFL
jgi:hypothetical protein